MTEPHRMLTFLPGTTPIAAATTLYSTALWHKGWVIGVHDGIPMIGHPTITPDDLVTQWGDGQMRRFIRE